VDRAKILALIDLKNCRGLEIGAQTRPVVTRDMGRVEYVDRASTDELRRWYANDPSIDRAQLVEVDHVWGEKTLLDCVGGTRTYDYVIASHVLEHVPDLLGWLGEIARPRRLVRLVELDGLAEAGGIEAGVGRSCRRPFGAGRGIFHGRRV
jgi:hypothetical protein